MLQLSQEYDTHDTPSLIFHGRDGGVRAPFATRSDGGRGGLRGGNDVDFFFIVSFTQRLYLKLDSVVYFKFKVSARDFHRSQTGGWSILL